MKASIVLALALAVDGSAQPAAPPAPTQKPVVIHSGVELVQVDTVVVDGQGSHVTDLEAGDFEIREDGRPQEITHCEYVAAEPTEAAAPTTAAPAALRREDVTRAMAIVVDDLGIAFSDIQGVRSGLAKFVEEDLRPTDLVAVVRTSGGMGILQQFTNDKDILRGAVAQVRYNGLAGGALTAGEAAGAASVGGELGPSPTDALATMIEGTRRQVLMLGTLGALEYVIDGLRTMPGRKSVVLFSSILSLRDHFQSAEAGPSPGQEIDPAMVDAVRRLTDRANLASVVLYTVDPRGLQTVGPQPGAMQAHLANRQETQAGLQSLAEETGGLFRQNSNDMRAELRDIVADQKGYYLLGYVPGERGPRRGSELYSNIEVKVRRRGLSVRSRKRYAGRLSPEAEAPARRDDLLLAAASPFARSELAVRATSLLLRDAKEGHLARTFLHVDGKGLSFEDTKEPEVQRTRLEISTATFGSAGVLSDSMTREVAFPLPARLVERLKAEGLVLEMNLPVKKPGVYQMRAAVRDPISGRVGSARQFLHVPPIQKNRLAMSGLLLKGLSPEGGGDLAADPESNPAVRRFKPGRDVVYGFVVYGAASADRQNPGVETLLRLYRDTRLLSSTSSRPTVALPPPPPKDGGKTKDAPREPQDPMLLGSFHLSPAIAPGEYTLEVQITDPGARPPHNVASQRIDFEIVSPAAARAEAPSPAP